ncbi:MAG: homoserine kinase [Actinobacteria bacterium]|nr:homoserine kinase [Actinomycetota bacterium]
MIVQVPGSSANLGPGFDTLGMALSVHLEIGSGDVPEGARRIDEHHPATVAHRRAGGEGPLWERCAIPVGRGLGFSGAARVGGALLARAQQAGGEPGDVARGEVLALATDLEGHADNVAASLHGGVVATAAGRVARVPLGLEAAVVVWIPSTVTKTDESRRALGAPVPFDDVVFNLGRVALLVAALASGDVDALRTAAEDRVHQPVRLAQVPASGEAIDAAYAAGAWAAWLSGSGPTVAALCAPGDAAPIADRLPPGGHTKVLAIDLPGAQIEPPYTS